MAGPAPAVAAVRLAVRTELADLPAGARVLVACSGGPDSMALAAATAFEARAGAWQLAAVVVDHGWHPESAQVATEVAGRLKALGYPEVLVRAVAPAEGAEGPEALARNQRYAVLNECARELGAAAILLGHNRNDQAETVLMRLVRGSGARSLAGMPARRGLLRRPLLEVSRETIEAACQAEGLVTWQDPANADPAYLRVRARDLLAQLSAQLGPSVVGALARTAEQLGQDAQALEDWAERVRLEAGDGAAACQHPGSSRLVSLRVEVLAAAPEAVRRRVLLAAAREAGSPGAALSARHVQALDALVVDYRGQGAVSLPGGIVGVRDCGRLLLGPPGSTREGD